MMQDEHSLYTLTKEKYPDLPYFMFGHSMGSMIARDYIANYKNDLDGVVLCGTTTVFPNVKEYIEKLEGMIAQGKAHEADPDVPTDLLGWLFERCEDVKLGNEWISYDPYVQIDHANDPFDAFTKPTHNISWLYFAQMLDCIVGRKWAEEIPKDLPIYCIAGDHDPVGLYGEGVLQCVNWLVDTGHKVKSHIYCGYRHEIHNNKEIRAEVEQGIIDFLDENLGHSV